MTIPDKSNLTSEELARSWGLLPPPAPTPKVIPAAAKPRKGGYYLVIGDILGALIGFATFLGAYIYCISEYGFLFGFGLGWIPSGLLAVIVGQVARFLWGPMAVLIVIIIARMNH
jgi:hypothetical protein